MKSLILSVASCHNRNRMESENTLFAQNPQCYTVRSDKFIENLVPAITNTIVPEQFHLYKDKKMCT